jgi:hypothetical protein
MKLFKSKVLDLTITKIIDWNKPYNEIVIPKGFRLIKVWELMKLLESKERDKFLDSYKSKYNWFWCEQTTYAKANNYFSWLYMDGDLYIGSNSEYLASSYSDGRVVFVKLEGRVWVE